MIVELLITAMIKTITPLAGLAYAGLLIGSATAAELILPLPGLGLLAFLAILMRREERRARVEGSQ